MDDFSISIRVIGKRVDPDALSNLIGVQPTESFRPGDAVGRHGAAAELTREHGFWCLDSRDKDSTQFSSQLRELLRVVPADVSRIASEMEGEVDVFVGCFGIRDQSTLDIDPDVLLELGRRGWPLVFDFYT